MARTNNDMENKNNSQACDGQPFGASPVRHPSRDGQYLVCIFEWTGLVKDKPALPCWTIRQYTESRGWQRMRYTYDTGGYENFEVVAWQALPPLPTASDQRHLPAEKTTENHNQLCGG